MKEMIENRKDRGIIKSDFKIKGDQKPGSLWYFVYKCFTFSFVL